MATVLTQVGEEWIVDKLHETVQSLAEWIGWGTGTGAAKGSTDLNTPATEGRVQGTLSQPVADKIRCVGTITADGTKTISEAGLFNAQGSGSPPSGGDIIIHGDFAGIPVNASDQIEFTIDLEIT